MKKTYEGLEMEVIRFSTEDIITTSEATTNNNEQTTTQQQTPTQDQTPTQELTPAQESTGGVLDGYTATGRTLYFEGKECPEYTKDDDPYHHSYVYDGEKLVGPFS